MQVRSLVWGDSLEKGMATHSSMLAWRIRGTEEPGGLQSMGSERVRHDLVIKQQQCNPRIFGCPLQADCYSLPLPRWTAYESVLKSVLKGTSHLPPSSCRGGSWGQRPLSAPKSCLPATPEQSKMTMWCPLIVCFSFLFNFLSYESMIKHL